MRGCFDVPAARGEVSHGGTEREEEGRGRPVYLPCPHSLSAHWS